jgi:CxxC motif-containing protein (DUF1111 family)
LDFSVGNSFFRNPWVQAPATTDARDGLGPLFNTNGCQNCHIKDGRGHPPENNDTNAVSMLVRLSVPAITPQQKQQLIISGVIGEPTYGDQLQDFSLPGTKPEGQIVLSYKEHAVTFTDGEKPRCIWKVKPSLGCAAATNGCGAFWLESRSAEFNATKCGCL